VISPCVCDLTDALDAARSRLSFHLKSGRMRARAVIGRRADELLALPMHSLERPAPQARVQAIGAPGGGRDCARLSRALIITGVFAQPAIILPGLPGARP
jgi:hypothetical protein